MKNNINYYIVALILLALIILYLLFTNGQKETKIQQLMKTNSEVENKCNLLKNENDTDGSRFSKESLIDCENKVNKLQDFITTSCKNAPRIGL